MLRPRGSLQRLTTLRPRLSRPRPDGRLGRLLPLVAAVALLATSVGPSPSTTRALAGRSAVGPAPAAGPVGAVVTPLARLDGLGNAASDTTTGPTLAGPGSPTGALAGPGPLTAGISQRSEPQSASSTQPSATHAAVLTPQLASTLTAELARLRSRSRIPGVQAAIIFPDGHSWRAHAGFENYSARVPVRNTTPFPVASVSKTFLASLVVQLAGEGRFSLDDRLLSLVPGANVDARVTIRELLDHTSGVYDFFSNSKIDTAILACRSCAWTPQKSLAYVKKPYFKPGTGWAYSNTNYVLLGQLVERVTGKPYATLLRQRYFEPLGLISTYVQGDEPAPYPIVRSYRFTSSSPGARPQSLWDGTGVSPFRALATAAGSAGAIASSARDLAVWARALYGGHVLGGEGSKAMLDFAATALVHPSVPYGLGVQEYTAVGRTAYGHGGRLLGARSAIRYIPSENLAIAVVINTDRGDPGAIANRLAALILPPLPPKEVHP